MPRKRASPEYRVNYRAVRYPRLEFKTGTLLVIVPNDYKGEVSDIVGKHERWVHECKVIIERAIKDAETKALDLRRSEEEFRELVAQLVQTYAAKQDCAIGSLYFRKLNSKWASCSAQNNLTFNRYMRFLPQHLIEYVTYHELTHVKSRRHDTRFWREIKKKFDDSNQREKELMSYWFVLQKGIKTGLIDL
jgi:predicted metal-dependent hydrolase